MKMSRDVQMPPMTCFDSLEKELFDSCESTIDTHIEHRNAPFCFRHRLISPL